MDGRDAGTVALLAFFLSHGFHLADHFHQEQQLAVAGAWCGVSVFGIAPVVFQGDTETGVDDVRTILDVLLLTGPAFAVRRIGQHEVKPLSGKFIGGQGGTDTDVFRVVALDHHVRFTDGVGFVVDFLAVQVHVTVCLDGTFRVFDEVLRLGQHAA